VVRTLIHNSYSYDSSRLGLTIVRLAIASPHQKHPPLKNTPPLRDTTKHPHSFMRITSVILRGRWCASELLGVQRRDKFIGRGHRDALAVE
jgi:hypothetical protein